MILPTPPPFAPIRPPARLLFPLPAPSSCWFHPALWAISLAPAQPSASHSPHRLELASPSRIFGNSVISNEVCATCVGPSPGPYECLVILSEVLRFGLRIEARSR